MKPLLFLVWGKHRPVCSRPPDASFCGRHAEMPRAVLSAGRELGGLLLFLGPFDSPCRSRRNQGRDGVERRTGGNGGGTGGGGDEGVLSVFSWRGNAPVQKKCDKPAIDTVFS